MDIGIEKLNVCFNGVGCFSCCNFEDYPSFQHVSRNLFLHSYNLSSLTKSDTKEKRNIKE